MTFRKLRIAWSVFCGLAAVSIGVFFLLGYRGGRLDEVRFVETLAVVAVYATVALSVVILWEKIAKQPRFSLRTLLIATTLVAVGLGLIVYVVR
jgi:hypothetical protein